MQPLAASLAALAPRSASSRSEPRLPGRSRHQELQLGGARPAGPGCHPGAAPAPGSAAGSDRWCAGCHRHGRGRDRTVLSLPGRRRPGGRAGPRHGSGLDDHRCRHGGHPDPRHGGRRARHNRPAPGAVDQRMASRSAGPRPVSRLGPPAMLGVRAVATGSGAWGALGVSVGAVAGIVATLTFGASLSGLLTTPMHYGQGWDRAISANFEQRRRSRRQQVSRRSGREGHSGRSLRRRHDLRALRPGVRLSDRDGRGGDHGRRGSARVGAGRDRPGGETLEGLGLRLGDVAQIDAGDGSRSVKVVGRVVPPPCPWQCVRDRPRCRGTGAGRDAPAPRAGPRRGPGWRRTGARRGALPVAHVHGAG